MTDRVLNVAIDGPAAAGKSTVSKALARRLGLALVDTGALYRGVALASARLGVAWDDDEGLGVIATELDIGFRFEGAINRVFLSGDDVSDAIRTAEMSRGASAVSARPSVRAGLLDLQRRLAARPPGAVLEGRDIGTVVLPDALVKFFLTASPEVRARRRYDERIGKGEEVSYEDVLQAERERDRADTDREISPLKPAEDAILVDSSTLDADGVIRMMEDVIRQRAPWFSASDRL